MSSKITRKKGQSGRAKVVQCIQCGKMVPRDKAVEKRKPALRLGHRLRALASAAEEASSITAYPAPNTENMCRTWTPVRAQNTF